MKSKTTAPAQTPPPAGTPASSPPRPLDAQAIADAQKSSAASPKPLGVAPVHRERGAGPREARAPRHGS
jgi:hypothetical protein